MKDTTIIVITFLAAIALIAIVVCLDRASPHIVRSCESFENWQVQDLPARCLKHFSPAPIKE